jgi:uncharacterized repeat protein (TIGR01451 family)
MRKVTSVSVILVLCGVGLFLSGCYSCDSYHKWKGDPLPPEEVAHKAFWSKACKACYVKPVEPAPAPAPPKPVPPPVQRPKPQTASECGPYAVSMSFPYGGSPVIRLDKTMPKEVPLNASFEYYIRVTNLTDVMVSDIVVTETVPGNFKYAESEPAAKKDANQLVWTMESLDPKASEQITVVGMATSTDCLQHCATVTYVIPVCANVQVVEPRLKLAKTSPDEVLICDPIPVRFVVTNSGTGVARDVKVTDSLPDGLRTADGKQQVTLNAGTLAAGQSKQFSVELKASKTGKYVNKAVASSSDGLKAEATTTTVVRQPVLTIVKTGPRKLYLGRPVSYEITVTNTGDAAAQKTVVRDTIPRGVTSVKVSAGGKRSGSEIIWELGTLAAGASKTVSISYAPTSAGTVSNKATAAAYCADAVSASASTAVAGIPAILLEVIDVEDPIEVGNQETYVITATNQGSAAGTNIRIVCTFEDEEEYVSSSGPTTGSAEGNTVTFAPLPSLAPKAKATWRVVVRAVKQGKVLFKVTMMSDEFPRPVEETESTNLYE